MIIIAGGGKLGTELAALLTQQKHKVTIIEKDKDAAEKLRVRAECTVIEDDACNPSVLKNAGASGAEIVIAVTGHDEDNLIISQLAKLEFNVPRVIAKINNPKNEWLFTKEMGVDSALSAAHIVAQLIEEKAEEKTGKG
jgi:trk system potassium uptake protein TrkA